jgi:Na+:H+ antiporter, NhaC family
MENTKVKQASIFQALIPIVFLIGLLSLNVLYFKDSASSGPNQIALLMAAFVAGIIGLRLKYSFEEMLDEVVKSISSTMPAIIILLLIGALAGTWMLSGIVPTMIFYGLKILNPTIFLFAACVVCAIVSLATGSSWSTIATIGVALLGIGQALGISNAVIAGAIISGAYFGDKMSPLSDTTNLAPAMAGTDLFTHIRYMMYTTIPSISIALIIFLIIGFTSNNEASQDQVNQLLGVIENKFNLSPFLFIVPAVVIFLIVKKVSAIPALFIGAVLGGVAAVIFQPDIIKELSDKSFVEASYITIIETMANGINFSDVNTSFNTIFEVAEENQSDLLKSKGMFGMLNTVWLVLCAMIFGGFMVGTGMLNVIAQAVVKSIKTTAGLISATVATCIGFNITTSDQYLAIVVPGRMYKDIYEKRNLKPEVLSRTLEDSGTVTSVLVPWNTCGATQSSILGVATGEYFMYCFFNWISPLMSIIFAIFNIKIRKIKE